VTHYPSSDPAYAPSLSERNPWIIVGIVYSSLSALAMIPAVLLNFFSVFLFDSPHSTDTMLPYFITGSVVLIPILILCSNAIMWPLLIHRRIVWAILFMTIPILYPFAVFTTFYILSH